MGEGNSKQEGKRATVNQEIFIQIFIVELCHCPNHYYMFVWIGACVEVLVNDNKVLQGI